MFTLLQSRKKKKGEVQESIPKMSKLTNFQTT